MSDTHQYRGKLKSKIGKNISSRNLLEKILLHIASIMFSTIMKSSKVVLLIILSHWFPQLLPIHIHLLPLALYLNCKQFKGCTELFCSVFVQHH